MPDEHDTRGTMSQVTELEYMWIIVLSALMVQQKKSLRSVIDAIRSNSQDTKANGKNINNNILGTQEVKFLFPIFCCRVKKKNQVFFFDIAVFPGIHRLKFKYLISYIGQRNVE